MFRRLLSMNKKEIRGAELERFETGNWMEHIEKYKNEMKGKRKFFYNNVPVYNEGNSLNGLSGVVPGVELDKDNKLIEKN